MNERNKLTTGKENYVWLHVWDRIVKSDYKINNYHQRFDGAPVLFFCTKLQKSYVIKVQGVTSLYKISRSRQYGKDWEKYLKQNEFMYHVNDHEKKHFHKYIIQPLRLETDYLCNIIIMPEYPYCWNQSQFRTLIAINKPTLMYQMCEGLLTQLKILYEKQTVHNDIALDNIVSNGRQSYLIDYELNEYLDRDKLETTMFYPYKALARIYGKYHTQSYLADSYFILRYLYQLDHMIMSRRKTSISKSDYHFYRKYKDSLLSQDINHTFYGARISHKVKKTALRFYMNDLEALCYSLFYIYYPQHFEVCKYNMKNYTLAQWYNTYIEKMQIMNNTSKFHRLPSRILNFIREVGKDIYKLRYDPDTFNINYDKYLNIIKYDDLASTQQKYIFTYSLPPLHPKYYSQMRQQHAKQHK